MGARMLRDHLHREGISVGRKHVTALRQRMGIMALARSRGQANVSRATTAIRTCCAICRSPGPIRLGPRTRLTSRRRRASSHRRGRCVRPPRAGAQSSHHPGGVPWHARDRQHGPRQPVHRRRVHWRCAAGRLPAVDRWARHPDGQRVCRAPVAQREVRTGVPEGLRQRQRGSRKHCRLPLPGTTPIVHIQARGELRPKRRTSPACRN